MSEEVTHNQTAQTSASHDVTAHPVQDSNDLSIRAIDAHSVHRITSGQVVIDLQTAVKELVENSLDAGATNIEVRFQNHGVKAIEVVDNGSGIAPKDYDSIALKHYTSKLSSFEDLSRILTFGFRGEALSSLCALSDGFSVSTAMSSEAPMGTVIEMDKNGKVTRKSKVARQRGTTVTVTNLFKPLPVRRKEFERNTKREFQKALNLLHAYALVPCARENKGVRLTVSNQTEGGRKIIQFKSDGTPSIRASVLALWGSKALENIVDLDLSFDVETEKSVLRRQGPASDQVNDILNVTPVKVQGLISKFVVGAGRTSVDRQYFFVNGRPYNPGKVQKAINEVYRTFNANQSPFVIADFILPTHACDINVSPDKRTIFLHSEHSLVQALKIALEDTFSSSRSTYDVRSQPSLTQALEGARPQQQMQALAHTHTQMLAVGRSQHLQPGPPSKPALTRLSNDTQQSDQPRGSTPSGNDGIGIEGEDGGRNEEITMGVPQLLLDPETESEPEPTLIAQPYPKHTEKAGKERGRGMIDRPRGRAPSEPLFFPESDEEGTGAEDEGAGKPVDKGKGRTMEVDQSSAKSRNDHSRNSRPPSSICNSTAATFTNATSISRSSTSTSNKPHSVQTVLNTRGAAWNLRKDADEGGEAEAGRERKRARVSGDRVEKTSFKSRLSHFVSSGSKRLGGRDEEAKGEDEGDGKGEGARRQRGDEMEVDSEEEVDELDGDENGHQGPSRSSFGKVTKSKTGKRSRSGSLSSQDTMVVPSDDEGAIDVDEPPSTIVKSSRIATSRSRVSTSSTAQVPLADVVDLTENDWDMSSTLVGSYVPPPGKTTTSSSSSSSKPTPADSKAEFVTLHVDLVRIGSHYLDLYTHLPSSSHPTSVPTPGATLRSAVSSANLETAAADNVASAALSRIISKADFEHMQVLGQFNLGFIIVRKRSSVSDGREDDMDDLFIVDQHAADEKWNFETLQERTVIESQKLFRPRQLQLTAADELLAIDNMDILKRNGFEVSRVDEPERLGTDCEEDTARPRLQLVAQPMSKDTLFDMKDLEELIHLMQDRPTGTMVRCSKARAMFAMRACRRSVMIGKALDKSHMTAIVRHMGMMDQPWNCPHGRPTMRHLSDLMCFGRYDPPKRTIDWEVFGRDEEQMKE